MLRTFLAAQLDSLCTDEMFATSSPENNAANSALFYFEGSLGGVSANPTNGSGWMVQIFSISIWANPNAPANRIIVSLRLERI